MDTWGFLEPWCMQCLKSGTHSLLYKMNCRNNKERKAPRCVRQTWTVHTVLTKNKTGVDSTPKHCLKHHSSPPEFSRTKHVNLRRFFLCFSFFFFFQFFFHSFLFFFNFLHFFIFLAFLYIFFFACVSFHFLHKKQKILWKNRKMRRNAQRFFTWGQVERYHDDGLSVGTPTTDQSFRVCEVNLAPWRSQSQQRISHVGKTKTTLYSHLVTNRQSWQEKVLKSEHSTEFDKMSKRWKITAVMFKKKRTDWILQNNNKNKTNWKESMTSGACQAASYLVITF